MIFYYSSVLWQAVGFSEKDSLMITVITSVVNIVTTLVAISRIDRSGRRPLLMNPGSESALGQRLAWVSAARASGICPNALHGDELARWIGGANINRRESDDWA